MVNTMFAENDLSIVKGKDDTLQKMCQCLKDNSYACISLSKNRNEQISALYRATNEFFSQSMEDKEINCDPKKENLGYIHIKGLNEYIKLRPDGDRKGEWPVNPKDYKNVYDGIVPVFQDLCWTVYTGLVNYTYESNIKKGNYNTLP